VLYWRSGGSSEIEKSVISDQQLLRVMTYLQGLNQVFAFSQLLAKWLLSPIKVELSLKSCWYRLDDWGQNL
jgi:hypothetical protein